MASSPYGIESELGEITTTAHKLTGLNKKKYDSGEDFFEETASREKFKSNRFMELALDLSTDTSVRNAARRLNRIRHEKEGISPTTYRNTIEREGQKIQKHLEEKSDKVLVDNGFNPSGELPKDSKFESGKVLYFQGDTVEKAAKELNIKEYKLSDYELPEAVVNVSIDDVCVKRQTETRPRIEETPQPKRVNNTVIHIENTKGKYILNAAALLSAIKLLIGFLLQCGLTKQQIVVFTDGAREIHSAVLNMLWFANCKIILDWYHLKKKFQEQLSMGLRGRVIRNKFLEELLPCLWFGNIDGAISLLRNIDKKKVKDPEIITKLIEYLERVKGYIPCYALRSKLGLRNSSNAGEKANDMVVSSRQKHNGMSWSNDGSVAFATVSAVSHNNEMSHWIHDRNIAFELFDKAA